MPGTIDVIMDQGDGGGDMLNVPPSVTVPLASAAAGIQALVRIGQSAPRAGLGLGAMRAGVVGPGVGALAQLVGRGGAGGVGGIGGAGGGRGAGGVLGVSGGGILARVARVLGAGAFSLVDETAQSVELLSKIMSARALGVGSLGVGFSSMARGGRPSAAGKVQLEAVRKAASLANELAKTVTGGRDPSFYDKTKTTGLFTGVLNFFENAKRRFQGLPSLDDPRSLGILPGESTSKSTTQPTRRPGVLIAPEGGGSPFVMSLSEQRRFAGRSGVGVGDEARKKMRGEDLTEQEKDAVRKLRGIEAEEGRMRFRGFGVNVERTKVPGKDEWKEKVIKELDAEDKLDEGQSLHWVWPLSNNYYS